MKDYCGEHDIWFRKDTYRECPLCSLERSLDELNNLIAEAETELDEHFNKGFNTALESVRKLIPRP